MSLLQNGVHFSGTCSRLRTHRLKEAEAGFPLLRGCPNTTIIARLAFLDTLCADNRMAFANQISDLAEAQAERDMTVDARGALMRALPLVEAFLGAAGQRSPAQGAAFLPVKLYAGICKDKGVGGFDGWAKMVGMTLDARAPAPAHAASLDELVPVAPRRLRKLIDDAMSARFSARAERVSLDHTRYVAPLPDGNFTVDAMFPRGMGSSCQFDYRFGAQMTNGGSVWMQSYEGVWLSMSRWDYLTEANAERSVAHLARLAETYADLI